jgi:hypothetical protein
MKKASFVLSMLSGVVFVSISFTVFTVAIIAFFKAVMLADSIEIKKKRRLE